MTNFVAIFHVTLAINIVATLALCHTSILSFFSPSSPPQAKEEDENDTEKQTQALAHRRLLYFTYLPVYLLATFGDWIQGPYKYSLYSAYGYSQSDVATLFVAGYGSGMILGSFVGSMADRLGRRKLCFAYCGAYILSCLAKHFRPFVVLLLGRVLGGIATSLLFSVFDSWLIKAMATRGIDRTVYLPRSLSVATYGSSVVAILAGLLANAVTEGSGPMRPLLGGLGWEEGSWGSLMVQCIEGSSSGRKPIVWVGGYISAFDFALPPLMLAAVLALLLWEENYGDKEKYSCDDDLEEEEEGGGGSTNSNHRTKYSGGLRKVNSTAPLETNEGEVCDDNDDDINTKYLLEGKVRPKSSAAAALRHSRHETMLSALGSATRTVWRSSDILTCCIISSVFEGGMYVFIFMWTPALTALEQRGDNDDDDAPALPFGWIFATFMVCCMFGTTTFSNLSDRGVSAKQCLVAILALSAFSCALISSPSSSNGGSTRQYIGMLLYEACIGAYYPAMGTVKGILVPEDQRAAIYNVFRLPLNFVVLVNLLAGLTYVQSFRLNTLFMFVACGLQLRLKGGRRTMFTKG